MLNCYVVVLVFFKITLVFQQALFKFLCRNEHLVGNDALVSHKQSGGATSCKLQEGYPDSVAVASQIHD